MKKLIVSSLLLMIFVPIIAQKGFVVDHTTTDIHAIPGNWIDSAKAKLKIRYFRRSHGSHVDVGGMAALCRFSTEYAEKFNYNATGAGGALHLSTIWHSLDFENDSWVQITRDYLDDPANAEINVVMWAWSSYMYNLDVGQYLIDMEDLIADYGPGGTKIENGERSVPVTFVFQTGCQQKSIERNEEVFIRNQLIRQHCRDNNRILFDFNDLESYNPDGEYFGDAAINGTYTNEHMLGDDCSYRFGSGGRGNWGIEWNAANSETELAQLAADDICVTCEHSMGINEGETKDNSRLHCVLKGRAAWWLWAKLAGWDAEVKNVWTGNYNSDWNNRLNWSKGYFPNAFDNVLIPSGIDAYPVGNFGSSVQVNGLVLESGANLLVPEGVGLKVKTDLELFSDKENYSQIIDNENIIVNGKVLYNKVLTTQAYHYLASPLSNVHSSVFTNTSTGINPNFYVYLEPNAADDWMQGWDYSAALGTMQAGRGYAYYNKNLQAFSLSGGQLNSGDVAIEISNSNNQVPSDGWNLVANPYASAISADEFINENKDVIRGTLYFWDDDNSGGADYTSDDYALWNLAGAIGTGFGTGSGEGSKIPDGFIAPMQGFFVKKTNPGTQQLWFRNSMRTFGQGQYFKTAAQEPKRFKLSLSSRSKKLYNEILIAFATQASNRFDNLYDGIKLKGNTKIAFYSFLNQLQLGIQSFGAKPGEDLVSKSVALGYDVSQSGDYEINIVSGVSFSSEEKLYLEDKLLNTVHNLSENGAYSFTSEKGEYHQRFVLHINPPARLLNQLVTQTIQPQIYSNQHKIIIETSPQCNNANYTIYSLMGFPITQGTITNQKTEISLAAVHKSALVKINYKEGEYTKKVVLE